MKLNHLLVCLSIVGGASTVHASLPFECSEGEYCVPVWEDKEVWVEGVRRNICSFKIQPCEKLELKDGTLVPQGYEKLKVGGRWMGGYSHKNTLTPYNAFNFQRDLEMADQTFFLEYADRTKYTPTRFMGLCLQLSPSKQGSQQFLQHMILPNGVVWDVKAVVEPIPQKSMWEVNFYAKSPLVERWDQDVVCIKKGQICTQEAHKDHSITLPMTFYPEAENHQVEGFSAQEKCASYQYSISFGDYPNWEFKDSIPLTLQYAQHGIQKISGKLVCDGTGPIESLEYQHPYVVAKRTNGIEEKIFQVVGAFQK